MTTDQVNPTPSPSSLADDVRTLLYHLAQAREEQEAARAALREAEASVAGVLANPSLEYKKAAERVDVLEESVRSLALMVAEQDVALLADVRGLKIVSEKGKKIVDERAAVSWLIERGMRNVLGVTDKKNAIAIGEAAGAEWVKTETRWATRIATDLRKAFGGEA